MEEPSTRTGSKTKVRMTSASAMATAMVSTHSKISRPNVFFFFSFFFAASVVCGCAECVCMSFGPKSVMTVQMLLSKGLAIPDARQAVCAA